jgi:serine/threonine protein kinase
MSNPENLHVITCSQIGKGANGTVYIGFRRMPGSPPLKAAIKKVPNSHDALKEVTIMSSTPPHQNICKLYDTWINSCGKRFIAMEFIKGEDLNKYLDAHDAHDPDEEIDFSQICQILLQVFSAIAHLHEHLIFHGDIKPANIMIFKKEDGTIEIKIVDFGQSSHFDSVPQKHQGSPLYFSPEIAHTQGIDSKSDIWSMGLLILHFLTRSKTPWYLIDARKVDDVVQILKTLDFAKTPFPRELLEHEDPNIVFLARISQRCLSLDKSVRPSAQDVVTELMGKLARDDT